MIRDRDGRALQPKPITRDEFYSRAGRAFAILATGETRPYGCFLLTKGVLPVFSPSGEGKGDSP